MSLSNKNINTIEKSKKALTIIFIVIILINSFIVFYNLETGSSSFVREGQMLPGINWVHPPDSWGVFGPIYIASFWIVIAALIVVVGIEKRFKNKRTNK